MSTVYLILGSIGSGKSTVSDFLCSTIELGNTEYIGSDIYKKKYFDIEVSQSSRGYRCADELVFKRIEQICLEGQDFIFELCPTNSNKIRTLKSICKQAGYNVVSFYVGTNDVQINITRCTDREINGADVVDKTKIKKRYFDSMKHILELIRMSKKMYFVDNSDSVPKIVGYTEVNNIYLIDGSCQWLKTYVVDKLV